VNEHEAPTTSLRIIGKIFDPFAKYLYSHNITPGLIPFILASIFMYFIFRKHEKGKSFKIQGIAVIIWWIFTIITGIISQYAMMAKPWLHK